MHPESDISEVDDADDLDETLLDRIVALKDIVPPTYRKQLSNATEKGYSWASSALSLSGKTLWVVSTSALLLGVPWALAFSEEQQVQEMEREMRMQQSANEVCDDGRHEFCGNMRANDDGIAAHARLRADQCETSDLSVANAYVEYGLQHTILSGAPCIILFSLPRVYSFSGPRSFVQVLYLCTAP